MKRLLSIISFSLILPGCANPGPYRSGAERAVLLTDQLDLAFPGGYLREKSKEEYSVIVRRMEGNLAEETHFEEENLDLFLKGFFDQMLVYNETIQQKAADGRLQDPPWKRK